jgi:hypothetical protein
LGNLVSLATDKGTQGNGDKEDNETERQRDEVKGRRGEVRKGEGVKG